MTEYVLGTSDHELARLELQQRVWGGITERFLDRMRIEPGQRVLDAGCGPGFVVESLRVRVGTAGRVVALDESPKWLAHLARTCGEHGWRNVHMMQSTIEDAALEPASFDLIFLRWVLSFLRDPGAVVDKLAQALKPGGVLCVQDYNHEGVSLFPASEGFRAVVRATRAMYASRGGDAWIAGRLPALARANGLELFELTPHVLCGGPQSDAFRWADAFFPYHSDGMLANGLITKDEHELFHSEWNARRSDPDALFFSPFVVDCAARKHKSPAPRTPSMFPHR
jgi:SAM-dependent methyltransferase